MKKKKKHFFILFLFFFLRFDFRFLNEEWRTKKMDPDDTEAKKFTPRNTPVHACDVPQQPETNEVDCGVYLLHYVEQWLKNPFPPEVITVKERKR